ncbi:uroporphyrinogen decarboxylase family protein [Sphingobium sp.]|uniref:uroporphyrinogen decarboxylase family protein n=1 Tax=Sphingobium sp. TaxID=1912891 RepID=UPI002637A426|nr:uroporphyrinogen decarboxylase family protein [Sphingobium sp.]
MNRRERLTAAVAMQPVDRVPISAWGHFQLDEMAPEPLADSLYNWFVERDFDFLKIQPRASYQVEGWGFEFTPATANGLPHSFVRHPIKEAADWKKLEPLPLTVKPLADQLETARILRARVGPDVPLLMTCFSPMDMAEKMVNRDPVLLRHYLAEAPDAVEHALQVFADTFAAYVKELVAIGIDGIFLSSRWTNPDRMAHADYARIARPRDLQVLEAARDLPFNTLHLCGGNIEIPLVADYPVSIIHWDHVATGNPTLAEGQKLCGKAVCGGVAPKIFGQLTPDEVREGILSSIRETNGIGYVGAPGCTVSIFGTPEENFVALRKASDEGAAL